MGGIDPADIGESGNVRRTGSVDFLSSFDYIAPILQITLIDLLLSGDNALVIAMACAHLPSDVRRRAMVLGTFAAIFFRVILTLVATVVLRVPYLKLVGALALLWIGISLLTDDDDARQASKARSAAAGLGKAIAIIVSADLVMSLDNVLAVAAAAEGHLWFLILGLLGSIPVLLVSSVLISRLLDAYPFLIRAGGGLLGWIAGRTAVSDPAYAATLNTSSWGLVVAAPVLGALYVLGQARLLRREPGDRPEPPPAPVLRKPVAPPHAPLTLPSPPAGGRGKGEVIPASPANGKGDMPPPPLAAETGSPKATSAMPAENPPPLPLAAESGGAGAEKNAGARPFRTTAPLPEEPPDDGPAPDPQPASPVILPKKLSRMDLAIMAGIAIPVLLFLGMILFFVCKAVRP